MIRGFKDRYHFPIEIMAISHQSTSRSVRSFSLWVALFVGCVSVYLFSDLYLFSPMIEDTARSARLAARKATIDEDGKFFSSLSDGGVKGSGLVKLPLTSSRPFILWERDRFLKVQHSSIQVDPLMPIQGDLPRLPSAPGGAFTLRLYSADFVKKASGVSGETK